MTVQDTDHEAILEFAATRLAGRTKELITSLRAVEAARGQWQPVVVELEHRTNIEFSVRVGADAEVEGDTPVYKQGPGPLQSLLSQARSEYYRQGLGITASIFYSVLMLINVDGGEPYQLVVPTQYWQHLVH